MITNPFQTADKPADVQDDALRRMLAYRDQVRRRWLSPDMRPFWILTFPR